MSALTGTLERHGIDTSDFRKSLVAFINQGIINAGEIRGSVANKIRSFTSRRRAGAHGVRGGR